MDIKEAWDKIKDLVEGEYPKSFYEKELPIIEKLVKEFYKTYKFISISAVIEARIAKSEIDYRNHIKEDNNE
jgi:hypothetical protein